MQIITIGRRITAYASALATATLGLSFPAHAAVRPTRPASDSSTLNPGAEKTFILNCVTGNWAVGGGGLSQTPFTRVLDSYPHATEPYYWVVRMKSFNSVPETVWARATCATGFVSFQSPPPGKWTGWIAPGAFGEAHIKCDSSRKAMGGGVWQQPSQPVTVISSYLVDNGWKIRVFNGGPNTTFANAYVTCAGSLGARTNPTPQVDIVPAGAQIFPIMTCPGGSWLASGGYEAIGDTNFYMVSGSLPLSTTDWLSWKWNIKNFSSVTQVYRRTLNCFDLL